MGPIDTMLQKRHSSYQKYYFTKMAFNINSISQKQHLTTTGLAFSSTTNTLLIDPTSTIRHRRVIGISLWSGKSQTLKSHNHESESYNKFTNFLLKSLSQSLANNFWEFFCKVYHFCKAPVFVGVIFQVDYLGCVIF